MGLQAGSWDWGRGVWSALHFHYGSGVSAALLSSIFCHLPQVAYIALRTVIPKKKGKRKRIVIQMDKHREICGRFHDPGVGVACIVLLRCHYPEFNSMETFNCEAGMRIVGPGRRNAGLEMGLKASAIPSLKISFVFQNILLFCLFLQFLTNTLDAFS